MSPNSPISRRVEYDQVGFDGREYRPMLTTFSMCINSLRERIKHWIMVEVEWMKLILFTWFKIK